MNGRPLMQFEHDAESVRLCIAKAVWSAFINHSPMTAARVALDGKTTACVRKWFDKNSGLVLSTGAWRRSTCCLSILVLLQICAAPPSSS